MTSGTAKRTGNPAGGVLTNERGVVFVVVLLIVAVVVVLAVSASSLAIGESRATPFWRDRNGAFYAAESGLNHTLWKLKNAGGTCVPEGTYPVDPPTFTSESETESAGTLTMGDWYEVWVKKDPVDLSVRHISVLGHSGEETYLLNATVDQVDDDPFYDPDGDGYESPDPDDPSIIGPDLPSLGPLEVKTKQTKTIGPGEFVYDYILLHEGATLKLNGDTTLWIKGNVDLKEGSVANPIADGHQLVIFIPPDPADPDLEQSITVRNSAVLNAYVYAPNAVLTLKAKSSGYVTTTGVMVVKDIITASHWTNLYDPENPPEIPWPATATVDYFVALYGE